MKRILIAVAALAIATLAACMDHKTIVNITGVSPDSVKTCYYVNQYHVCETKPPANAKP